MTEFVKTRINLADVVNGVKRAFTLRRGDLIASGAAAAVLAVVTAFFTGGDAIGLGVLLIAGVLANIARIIGGLAANVRDDRDLSDYYNSVFHRLPVPSFLTPTEEGEYPLADWERELLEAEPVTVPADELAEQNPETD